MSFDERNRADDLARRAETTLHRVRANERVNHRMVAKPFDRRHLAPLDAMSECDARECGLAVDEHRARAAVPLVARDLRPREPDALTERFGQRGPDRYVDRVAAAVDREL